MAPRGPSVASAAADHHDGPPERRPQPARTHRPRRDQRRDQRTRRHTRRDARTASPLLRQPATIRRQRFPRAAHTLTINRTLIEVALDDPQANQSLRQLGATLLAVNQRHERLIDGLLTLASSEQAVTKRTPVDLADITRGIATESQGAARNAGVDIRTHLQPAPVAGDPVLLERLIQNLVVNAIRYNLPEHGWITVTTDVVDDNVRLTVENTGPPVPPYEVPSLFEPFRRLTTTERLADSGKPRSAAEPDSDYQSCRLSPMHTVVMSTPRPGKTEASPYGYEYVRWRRNPNGTAHDWNSCETVRDQRA